MMKCRVIHDLPDRSVMQTSLPDAEPPADDELYGFAPDLDNDPPDGTEAWLAWLPTPLLEEQLQDGRSSLARLRVLAAGFLPRERDRKSVV